MTKLNGLWHALLMFGFIFLTNLTYLGYFVLKLVNKLTALLNFANLRYCNLAHFARSKRVTNINETVIVETRV